MAIVAKECIEWIAATIGAPTQDAAIQVLNNAGEHLTQMHEWRWLERESTVSLTADQDYASLPSDFRALLKANEDSSFSAITSGTIELMVQLKSAGFSGQQFFTGVVTYRTVSNVPTPVLRLDPTPESNETDAFNIAYLAGWTELSSDNSKVEIVPWCKNLYRELVIAFARGWDEDDDVRAAPPGQLLEEHLAVIRQGEVFKNAVRRDAQVNPSMGRIRKGWLQTNNEVYSGSGDRGYLRTSVGAPTAI